MSEATQRMVWENLTRSYAERAAGERDPARRIEFLIWSDHYARLAQAPSEKFFERIRPELLTRKAHRKPLNI
jgi:hypothetical protein